MENGVRPALDAKLLRTEVPPEVLIEWVYLTLLSFLTLPSNTIGSDLQSPGLDALPACTLVISIRPLARWFYCCKAAVSVHYIWAVPASRLTPAGH